MAPTNPVDVDVQEVLGRLEPEGEAMVLDVAVNLRRLQGVLQNCPASKLLAWNATASLQGNPGLGFSTDGWRAFLMGFENLAEAPATFDLVAPERLLFDLVMNQG